MGFFFWLIFLGSGLVFALACFLFYQQELDSWERDLKARESAQVGLQGQALTGEIRMVVADLLFLVDQFGEHMAQRAAIKGGSGLDAYFAEEVLLFAEKRRRYGQIRFLDNSGMETMRVNLAQEHAYLVPRDELSVQGATNFFQAAQKLEPGEVFVSSFDLYPPPERVKGADKPVISFASPLFGVGEKRRGILVLNFLGAVLAENFQRTVINASGRVMLVNNAGYWLSGMEQEGRNFGFMYARGGDWTFGREYNAAWSRILQEPAGQFQTEQGLFTFMTFSPDAEVLRLTGQLGNALEPPGRRDQAGENWKVVSFVPGHLLLERKSSLQQRIFGSYAAVMVFAFLGCGYSLHATQALRSQRRELRAMKNRCGQAVQILEQQNIESGLVRRMTDFLLTCKTVDECWPVIVQYAKQLFPDTHGGLYLFHELDHGLAKKAEWGEAALFKDFFEEDECWALRRGKIYVSAEDEQKLACSHFSSPPGHGYFCFPLIAPGGCRGLLTILPAGVLVGKENRAVLRTLAQGFVEEIALVLANISLRAQVHDQAIRDHLTALYNRHYMVESLDRELARAARQESSVGLIMFDLDNFKQFNELHGHDAGDRVLMELGKLLLLQTRKEDIACRFSGKKFMLILPGSNLEHTSMRAEMLREMVENNLKISYHGKRLSGITISLGVSGCPEHGRDGSFLVSIADQALCEAKAAGHNRLQVAAVSAATSG
ncbi:MAG: diguanylate cyclase [Desulfobulbaceae bacterium]|nr:diguanylate cyclase [Desulfobulbaceae bacterium]HIJ79008.1 diguanylate cyclase [Deltaproteobacteria bacterium]